MCGIVVGLSFGKLNQRDEAMRQRLLRYFTTELLVRTEERGKDATGAVVLFDDGKYMGLKRGETVSGFVGMLGEQKDCFGSLLKVWREHDSPGRIYMGHCRAGTIGEKEDNNNNHPIKVGNLIGIHNGAIKNHDEIFENLKCARDGKVDSEAIFRLFEHYTNKGKEPFTMDMIQTVANRLEGQFAITLFNADNLEQVPVFRDGRPVELVLIRKYGILFMISEEKFWNHVHFNYERLAFYSEELLQVKLPSFLDDNDIETKVLPDDSAIIFDLTLRVGEDTKIDDLGEWQKIKRDKKIWGAKTTTSTTYASGYHYGAMAAAWTSKSDDDKKKRRVFDSLTKLYVLKIGDKVLKDEDSVVLSVAQTDTSKNVPMVIDNEDKEKGDIKKDSQAQADSKEVKIDDITEYDSKDSGDVPASEAVIDAEVVEVDMTTYPKELVEAAEKAYDSIPFNLKGYSDIEDLISAIDLESAEKARELGITVVANRTFKINWKAGFMAGMAAANKNGSPEADKEKVRKRESHIAGLKSMLLLMAGFYQKSDDTTSSKAKTRLAGIVMQSNRSVNMEDIEPLFNEHEKKVMKEISEVMHNASKYK